MELDIRLLRTFRVVAQTRSFTGAARKLKLTQSSISQQVSALERELKTHLLVRSNKFVGLTTGGEILLQCACQVLDSIDRVRALLAEQSKQQRGTTVRRSSRDLLPLAAAAPDRRVPRTLSGDSGVRGDDRR